jgi:hypothetical protein
MTAVLKEGRPDSERLSDGIRRHHIEVQHISSGVFTTPSDVWYNRAIEASTSHCDFDKPDPEECRRTIEDAETKEEMLEVLRGRGYQNRSETWRLQSPGCTRHPIGS